MVAKPFDLEANHPLYPRREILAEYAKVNTADSKFEYEKNGHDRVYEQWYAFVKGRPVTEEVTHIWRRKIANEGEFIIYHSHLLGKDWKGNDKAFDTIFGRYDKPIFVLEKDPETQKVTTTQVSDHKTIYDIPYTKEKLDELLEMSIDGLGLAVNVSAGRRLGVTSLEDYRNGSFEDLVMCANKGKSLQTVLAEKGQFTYEKRERKDKTEIEERHAAADTTEDVKKKIKEQLTNK